MFSIFKSDPAKKMKKEHHMKLEQAMLAQRKGDIRSYSTLTAEAEEILERIQQLESAQK